MNIVKQIIPSFLVVLLTLCIVYSMHYIFFMFFRESILGSYSNELGHIQVVLYFLISSVPLFYRNKIKQLVSNFNVTLFLIFWAIATFNPITLLVFFACGIYRNCI
ncbi:hypothetical protein CH373_06075 [Leptospira perolatii]|uniref:Uncharacterized protein n=1 Tax=Leptospira perolatii TaxID=2023191 RepID=A0A2M9ZNS0_9LEPT|nr:hypothetical protein CH360_04805 [Leptospira perolatii]PJZ73730.1 hypothetical protein CH373_06075 [Leptospira perolatii]